MASASSDATVPAPAASYSTDPALYIYTSLTAGSSHIVTATSRLETILRANRVPFKAIDLATDERARMLWGRRAGKDESGRVRKLPGLVQMGVVLGDLVEIEDWNEYGELKRHVKIYYDEYTQPSISQAPKLPPPMKPKPAIPAAAAAAAVAGAAAAAAASAPSSAPAAPPLPAASSTKPPAAGATATLPIRSVAEEAAQKAKDLRLQSLREKVYGKGGKPPADGEKDNDKEPTTASTKKPEAAKNESSEEEEEGSSEEESSEDEKPNPKSDPRAAGLQSPTSTGWKTGPGATTNLGSLQSPTTTSWKPTDVDAPITSFLGSPLQIASAEEIAAVERAETIKEVPEEEERDSEDEESSEEEEEEKEVAKKKEEGVKK
ncbi:hypothetical protein QBC34DRAFT_202695 [Podospora aff. communis PSN243]|uniref:Uncharacterized protein n=1 Tax=Podospora aff. communis PSN243 TaxID=3040156 RepID=A0AAV9GZT3_9PEZI|nr:hypothetical protein QBC34DRAFT_202695 [Podospora aff. communis PSN243]